MSGLLWRLARDQTIEALVLGTLAAQARQRQAALGPLPVSPHPIPDLTGESVEVVVQAVLDAIVAAHSGEWATDGTPLGPGLRLVLRPHRPRLAVRRPNGEVVAGPGQAPPRGSPGRGDGAARRVNTMAR